ncbi:MAG: hypothetical protein GC203_20085 [Phenylobacterium sp.]|uniref:hypothetical protein n=1 Tax=Phenylobacterium sp. TaxID=1871053 RepID=UPI0025D465D7|nr:hypothetical protein [Phenylobacterium sp.]MBI1200165.1 hypothetical protein [Phenylobacterium sp.]
MSQSRAAAGRGGATLHAVPPRAGPHHHCTVQTPAGRPPHLVFEPQGVGPSCPTAALVAVHLRPGVSATEAEALADHLNRLMDGVSATVL